jgi:parallel beta-helix repeat protein
MKKTLSILGLLFLLLAASFWTAPAPVGATGFEVNVDFDDADAHDANLGDCICADTYGYCTLRAAIEEANQCPGTDTITFQFAMNITIASSEGGLPPVDETLTIDASSVWDTVDDEPGVMINGGGISFSGLLLNDSSCQIYGLYITNFGGTGIYVTSAANWIGGTGAGQRNVLSGNDTGITLSGSSAQNNILHNNYLGLTPAGNTTNPNGTGLLITGGAVDNIIGGNDAAQANFISGNTTNGVVIESTGSDNNWLGGNGIGLAADLSTQLGNGAYGIRIQNGPANTVIGGASGSGNFISYNSSSGVYVIGGSSGTQISHNVIGGNSHDGVYIDNSTGSVISDNIISSNTLNGVRVNGASAAGNLIWPNSIWNNDGKGILLQNGGNMGIAAPTIDSASPGGAAGTTCAGCRVAVYSDSSDEGQVYHDIVWADGAGNWAYTGVLAGPNVTATSIDISGNTSEFSAPYAIGHKIFLPLVARND